jgi:hypothetical protein
MERARLRQVASSLVNVRHCHWPALSLSLGLF